MMDCFKYLLGGTYQPGDTILGMYTALGFKYKVIFLPENILLNDNDIITSAC